MYGMGERRINFTENIKKSYATYLTRFKKSTSIFCICHNEYIIRNQLVKKSTLNILNILLGTFYHKLVIQCRI